MLLSAGVFLLVVLLLAVPVTVEFAVSGTPSAQKTFHVKWAFGLLTIRNPGYRSAKPAGTLDKKPTTRKKPANKKWGRKGSGVAVALVRRRESRRRIIQFIGDLWSALQKRDVRLHLRAGLGDPADTGLLWAVVGPVAGFLASLPHSAIRIEPDFFDPVFELNSSGRIRFIPLQLVYLVIALLLSPPIWQSIAASRRTHTSG